MSSSSTVVVFFRDTPGVNQGVIRGARNVSSSPLKHVVFLYYSKIAEYLGEEKWIKFFDVLSKGSSYKNLKFDGTSLTCKIKGAKVIKYDLRYTQTMNIATDLNFDIYGYRECQQFIEENTIFFVESDTKKDYITSEQNQEQLISLYPQFETNGALSSSLNSQIIFIGEYTCRKCREFKLSESVREALFSSIFAMLSCKDLTSKSFNIFSNGTIDSIDGVIIGDFGFYCNPVKPKNTRNTKVTSITTDSTFSNTKSTSWPSQRVIKWFN